MLEDKFLKAYNLLRWNHKQIENPKRPINIKIESITKYLPTKYSKTQTRWLTGIFYQIFNEKLTQIF